MSLFSICAVTDTLIEEEDLPEGHQGRRPRWREIGLRISYGAMGLYLGGRSQCVIVISLSASQLTLPGTQGYDCIARST